MLKKEMITVAIATIPNSLGSIKRAKIPDTIKEMIIPIYFAILG